MFNEWEWDEIWGFRGDRGSSQGLLDCGTMIQKTSAWEWNALFLTLNSRPVTGDNFELWVRKMWNSRIRTNLKADIVVVLWSVRGYIQKFSDWVYKGTTTNTRWEATQRIMAAKLPRMTHRMMIQLHLVAESYTICSSRSRRPVRKLLDFPSYRGNLCCMYAVPSTSLRPGTGSFITPK
jgi:hypothetical protein